ncbi:MAG: PIG-L family deacetylase [Bacteriovoracaceae bacterium]|nr:PIG-L family deacetylase [Bacteriovoracaceae bacterium]
MKFSNEGARIKYALGINETQAEARKKISHLAIGAHQDDIEIMALHGIVECMGAEKKHFAGMTCTAGGGSSRSGYYQNFTDAQIENIRIREQERAAEIGGYKLIAQLVHKSSAVKEGDSDFINDLTLAIKELSPDVVYTHNLADKHDTHVAVSIAVIKAIRSLDKSMRPSKIYGSEVWRGLDWMQPEDKVCLDISGEEGFAHSLISVFDSQIGGGKRYDLATLGRMRANSTYADSHSTDVATHLWYAMDLTPLIEDDHLDIGSYVKNIQMNFVNDVENRISRFL